MTPAQPHDLSHLRRVAFNAWMVSLGVRLVQAVIDNDVRGIITLGYQPQSLAARIIELPHALATLVAILVSGWLILHVVHRRVTAA